MQSLANSRTPLTHTSIWVVFVKLP